MDPPYAYDGGGEFDYESQMKTSIHDAHPEVRRGFAAKVLGQVCLLLALVAAICAAGMTAGDRTQAYILGQGGWIFYMAVIVSFAIVLSFFCFKSLLYEVPHKYVTLVIFGIAIGIQCMYATLYYTVSSVLMVAGLTASATLVLSVYAMKTSRDFTGYAPALAAAVWLLIAFGLLQIWFHDRVLQVLVASLGALVFSCYIVVDIQLILGGQHRVSYGLDDDVLATVGLFLDIINLFLYMLELFGDRR